MERHRVERVRLELTVPPAGPSPVILPRRVRFLMGAGAAAAAGSLIGAVAGRRQLADMTLHQWVVMGVVSLLACLGALRPVLLFRGEESESFTFSEAFLVILLLTEPPAAVLAGMWAVSLVAQLAKRRPVGKALFNVGQMAAASAAALGVRYALSPGLGHLDLATVGAAMAGAGVFFVINNGAVAAVLTAMGSTWRSCLLDGLDLRLVLSWSGVLAGVVLGVPLHDSTWPLLMAVPLLVLVRNAISARFKAQHDRARVSGLLDATLDAYKSLERSEVVDTIVRSARRLLRSPEAYLSYTDPGPGMAVPVRTDGEQRWLVAAGRRNEEPFEEIDRDLLQALAAVGAGALTNAELYRQVRYERERMSSVALSIAEGVVAVDVDGKLTFANAAAGEMVPLPAVTTIVGDHIDHALCEAPDFLRAPALACISSGQVRREGKSHFPSRTGGAFPVVYTASPIIEAGRPTGAVIAFHDMTEPQALEEELRHHALHDALTGLANRRQLVERLETLLSGPDASGRSHAVVFLDVDRFKGVNDSLGHAIGDELLVAVAGRLRHALRPSDHLARFGGDEFVALLHDVDQTEAGDIARRMATVVEQPIHLAEGYEFVTTVSVGIAMSGGGRNADDLLHDADVAMYDSKTRSHGGAIQFFNHTSMGNRSSVRLQLEADLRKAVELQQIEVHYQPRVTLEGQRLVGAEALVRWRHPYLGLLHPSSFMELAEETGLIVPVGRCVLEQAGRLSQAARDRTGTDLPVSINLSARQFRHSGLLTDIRRILRDTGAEPSAVTFEVTESMVMDDLSDALDLMGQMRAVGVNIAIDDFGTGHSSLGFLKRLPVQELKVDRSFVAGVATQRNDRAIVRAVIELAGAMNVTPVAEGVESSDQLDVLVELGCRFGQGYYLAPPMEASRLVERLVAEASPSDGAGGGPGSQGVIRPWVGRREAPTLPV